MSFKVLKLIKIFVYFQKTMAKVKVEKAGEAEGEHKKSGEYSDAWWDFLPTFYCDKILI